MKYTDSEDYQKTVQQADTFKNVGMGIAKECCDCGLSIGIMVIFVIILSLIVSLFIGCSTQRNVVYESHLNVTKKYCGNFINLRHETEGKFIFKSHITYVETSQDTIAFFGTLDLAINPGDKCYVKYFPEYGPTGRSKVYILYFTWENIEDLYRVRQNWFTGEVY